MVGSARVKTLFIGPGSPRENRYIESFNGKIKEELINRKIFITLTEAKALIEAWQKEYDETWPYSAF